MHAFWHWLLWCLAAWSHDPATLDAERARCAGAVNVAYAAMAQEPAPPPKRRDDHSADAGKMVPPVPEIHKKKAPEFLPELPPLPPAGPCIHCGDTGRLYRSDGGWVRCPCKCPTGKCPKQR